jgi:HD-like signal output (HDOD) protein
MISTENLSSDSTQQLLASIKIPPRPGVLIEVMAETDKDDPDLRKIGTLISKDIALSAATLKLVNSPLFGLSRKIDTPQQATTVLGLKHVSSLVTGLSLKHALGNNLSLERFWDSADRVASISALVAKKLPGIPQELAYLNGLFRDCGIPIMMQKFPEYKQTLQRANSEQNKTFIEVEEEAHATNHATIGYLLAKSWGLADTLCKAIQNHHDLSVLDGNTLPGVSSSLIAISYLAEHISNSVRMREDTDWLRNGKRVVEHLGISLEEFEDIKEEITLQFT